jgi:hypothetical protein
MDRRQQNNPPPPWNQPPGEVFLTAIYRVDELKRRMGWSDSAFRAAKGRGLKVHRDGKRAYVLGRELSEYLTGRTDDPSSPASNPTCAGR